MTLADESLEFARSIIEEWDEQPGLDLVSFQRRYLFVQALGASHTARAYWMLHDATKHYECHILARNLLERIFNCQVAIISPDRAGELIAYELEDRLGRLRTWHRDQSDLSAEMTNLIFRYEGELQSFQELLGISKVRKWSYYEKAKEAKISSMYRSLYSQLSCYTHAGYEFSRPPNLDLPSELPDQVAFLAPITTAMKLHRLTCCNNPCKVVSEYKVLYEKILRETHCEPISAEA